MDQATARKPATQRGERSASRKSADERRDELVRAAVAEFALYGLHGTSTEQIAKRVKISQPYVFRLFPTKKDLFIAAVDQCFDRVESAFREAANDAASLEQGLEHHHAESGGGNLRLHAMGHAYAGLLSKRELLLFQMQAYAACSDDVVRKRVRDRWERLFKLAGELSGASAEELTIYFARGMLMNVVASIGLVPSHPGKDWAHKTLGYA
jgi:AcrR family transcriptional regulator